MSKRDFRRAERGGGGRHAAARGSSGLEGPRSTTGRLKSALRTTTIGGKPFSTAESGRRDRGRARRARRSSAKLLTVLTAGVFDSSGEDSCAMGGAQRRLRLFQQRTHPLATPGRQFLRLPEPSLITLRGNEPRLHEAGDAGRCTSSRRRARRAPRCCAASVRGASRTSARKAAEEPRRLVPCTISEIVGGVDDSRAVDGRCEDL